MNVEHLIQSGGLLLIGAIVFAESGLLVGFFLPGDTLLFSAGFFASQGELPILGLMAVVMTAAIVGDNVGYEIGKRNGHRIFRKKDGLFFRHEHIARAEAFYEKHGGKTVILARFIPVVRTFAPVVAGVGKMSHRRFLAFNIVGGVLWGGGVSLLGYWLGSKIPNIDKYIYPIIGLAVALSVLPALHHLLGDKEVRQRLINKLRNK